jgi:EC042_2821-like Restriction Endonuclease-like domain
MDPNITHPYRQMDVLEKLASSHGGQVTSYVFQAVAWHYQLKDNDTMCWRDETVGLVKWSPEVVAFVKGLSAADLAAAKAAYAKDIAKRRRAA